MALRVQRLREPSLSYVQDYFPQHQGGDQNEEYSHAYHHRALGYVAGHGEADLATDYHAGHREQEETNDGVVSPISPLKNWTACPPF